MRSFKRENLCRHYKFLKSLYIKAYATYAGTRYTYAGMKRSLKPLHIKAYATYAGYAGRYAHMRFFSILEKSLLKALLEKADLSHAHISGAKNACIGCIGLHRPHYVRVSNLCRHQNHACIGLHTPA